MRRPPWSRECPGRREASACISLRELLGRHPADGLLLFSSDSDEKPLKGSPRPLARAMPATESADSLVQYGDGDHGLFSEDGSFIGAYAGSKEKGSVDSNGSSAATFPLRA